jgi:secreted trypsin-like serine protease
MINGAPVPAGDFAQTVALVYQPRPSQKGEIFCTGTLIGPHTVLTAAHCIATPMNDDIPVGDLLISHLGIYLGDSPPLSELPFVAPTVKVKKVYVHANFTPQSRDQRGVRNNDFALLELERDVDLKKYHITPFPLRANAVCERGQKISVIAFGMTEKNREKGLKRRGVFDIGHFDPFHFSFRSLADGLSLWHGDSGGSAYWQDSQNKKTYFVGIATFVAGGSNYFQSFDRLTMDWIKSYKDPLFQ